MDLADRLAPPTARASLPPPSGGSGSTTQLQPFSAQLSTLLSAVSKKQRLRIAAVLFIGALLIGLGATVGGLEAANVKAILIVARILSGAGTLWLAARLLVAWRRRLRFRPALGTALCFFLFELTIWDDAASATILLLIIAAALCAIGTAVIYKAERLPDAEGL